MVTICIKDGEVKGGGRVTSRNWSTDRPTREAQTAVEQFQIEASFHLGCACACVCVCTLRCANSCKLAGVCTGSQITHACGSFTEASGRGALAMRDQTPEAHPACLGHWPLVRLAAPRPS